MSLTERLLRRVADRPRRIPDYATIDRIERDLDAERRTEEREARRRAAAETCAREGHLEPTGEACEITTWGSPNPLRILPGCPRCGAPADDVSVEEIDAAVKLRSAGLL
jgi:hypothetical protein